MNTVTTITELSDLEIESVNGGVVPLAAAAFVAGAKWGAGVVIAAAALVAAMK